MSARPSVVVVVASLDRPDSLADILEDMGRQTEPADRIILSVTKPADLPEGLVESDTLRLLIGPKGLCNQRNTALEEIGTGSDIVLFCDDDYVPSRFLVERVRDFFMANSDVAGASGRLVADGINGPGITIADARAMLTRYDAEPMPPLVPIKERFGLYGCNMVYRRTSIDGLRFDARLALYGWQEDIDFAGQLRLRGGRLVATHAFAGVHCGVKLGRSSGVRLGYSQIINPIYLARKGTMRPRYAMRLAMRQFLANHARALRPEPWVDRLGRAKGNWLGIADLMLGRLTPERVIQL
jgi:GT2 family glycosyltransferase